MSNCCNTSNLCISITDSNCRGSIGEGRTYISTSKVNCSCSTNAATLILNDNTSSRSNNTSQSRTITNKLSCSYNTKSINTSSYQSLSSADSRSSCTDSDKTSRRTNRDSSTSDDCSWNTSNVSTITEESKLICCHIIKCQSILEWVKGDSTIINHGNAIVVTTLTSSTEHNHVILKIIIYRFSNIKRSINTLSCSDDITSDNTRSIDVLSNLQRTTNVQSLFSNCATEGHISMIIITRGTALHIHEILSSINTATCFRLPDEVWSIGVCSSSKQ